MADVKTDRTGRREQVLEFVRAADTPVTIAQIARGVSVHANTVRFHLGTLVANGQVEKVTTPAGTPGRPADLYRVAPGMDPMGPRHYRTLAQALLTALPKGAESKKRAAVAGRRLGHERAAQQDAAAQAAAPAQAAGSAQTADSAPAAGATEPTVRLVKMLTDMGFAPELQPNPGSGRIGLRNCPFVELATDRGDFVCPMHLAMMQGALEYWDASATVDRLEPFVEPGLCVAHLAAAPGSEADQRTKVGVP